MSFSADPRSTRAFDGEPVERLASRWGVSAVQAFGAVGSTLDVAHALAPAAMSGMLIIADEQTAGRGRQGRRWVSASGAGVWLTLVERPTDARSLDVLALRCGLYVAESLDEIASETVHVKWPNDLYLGNRKLAGTLIETRWRGTAPEWVAIGFGLNLVAPDLDTGIGLPAGVSRLAALDRIVPALRRAAAATHHLSADELSRWNARDLSVGRAVVEPGPGTVTGINAAGEVLIAADGRTSALRSGSLTFAPPHCP
ncbi:MAG: biotin--[acetyl-CoA-carboxylase] ligase [bacterium]